MDVWAANIADYLQTDLCGSNIPVVKPCSINNICSSGLLFLKRYTADIVCLVNDCPDCMAIVIPEYIGRLKCSYVVSKNPRLDFARVVHKFFVDKPKSSIASTACLGTNINIGHDVTIGDYSIIENNVTVGDRTEIRHHVVIKSGTEIGKDCLIKSNTVIGEEGFGFERDEAGIPIRIPHLGKVIIENNVEIGASVVLARGTLDDTIICSNVKIDDEVFIAHNVVVGKNSMIIAKAQISGSAKIGEGCWIGPNSSVINGINIGRNCFIGIGTVVIKSLPENVVAVGNPARILRINL